MAEWKPIETMPSDGKPVLVLLEKEDQGSRIHSAVKYPNGYCTIGHHFAFDCPMATHWMEQPTATPP